MIWPQEDAKESNQSGYRGGCVGWMDCLVVTKDCASCVFVEKVFFGACPGFPRDQVVGFSNRRRFCCFVNGLDTAAISELQPRADQWSCSFNIRFQEVSDFDLDEGIRVPYKPAEQLEARLDISCKDEAVRLYGKHCEEAALLTMSRKVAVFWNAKLMRSALRACREVHGPRCEGQASVFAGHVGRSTVVSQANTGLRVVDVNAMRIILLSIGSEYVVLSYCWASAPYTTLKINNLEEFCCEGGLRNQDLPPTVSDAIEAVKSLGEHYIWIASLCIIQDDHADKAAQLGHMDDVYRAATLTIIAAAAMPDGSDVGLPGIRPSVTCTRQKTLDVRGLKFRHNPADLYHDILKSRWHTRAWTFQEYLLSKRLLVFMPDQVH